MKPVTIAVMCASISLATLLACSRNASTPGENTTTGTPNGAAPATEAELTSALPFVENDYAAALSLAREAKLPLFVEIWAPW